MAVPRLYDVKETSLMVRMSVSWLYHNAGVTIPVTRIGGRLFWSEAQIEQIIGDGARPAKAVKREPGQREVPSPKSTSTGSMPAPAPALNIPRARPERSRRYRPEHLQ